MQKMKNKALSLLLNGIIFENPVFVLVLGTCPTLAVTSSVKGALGMGIAAMAVLVCSNTVISLLRKLIPNEVRIPCYIIVIAAFVTVVQMIMQAFMPELYALLGIYLALITVNCIILGRAEMFASKHGIIESALDGLGMGLGFTLALALMGTVREVFGNGSFLGMPIGILENYKIAFLTSPPGGFFVFGALIAIVTALTKGTVNGKRKISCKACPVTKMCGTCGELTLEEENSNGDI